MKSNLAEVMISVEYGKNNSADASTANNMTGLATGFIAFTKSGASSSVLQIICSLHPATKRLVEHLVIHMLSPKRVVIFIASPEAILLMQLRSYSQWTRHW